VSTVRSGWGELSGVRRWRLRRWGRAVPPPGRERESDSDHKQETREDWDG